MKRLLTAAALAAALAVLTPGCPDPAGDYADGMIKTKRKADKLKVEIDTEKPIQMFEAAEGRKPKSLDELKEFLGGELPEPPPGMDWELENGKLVPIDPTAPKK